MKRLRDQFSLTVSVPSGPTGRLRLVVEVGGLTGAGLGLFSVLGETDGERGVLLAEFLIPVEDAVACGYGLLDEIPTDRLEGVAFGGFSS